MLFTSRKHYLFFGENALKQALFFAQYGREVDDISRLYDYKPVVKEAMQWSAGNKTALRVRDTNLEGWGVHAKIYMLDGHMVLSSQNNGNSGLFEFAVLYPKKEGALERWFRSAFDAAKLHQRKWRHKGGLKVGF